MLPGVYVLAALLSLFASTVSAAPISIEINQGRVSIKAEKVPLVQLLNGVAWESKMKIIYDTAPPQDLVSVNIEDMTLSDAITQLLHGHGLLYVARMDLSGTRVDTLVLTTAGPGTVQINPPEPAPEPEVVEPPPDYVEPPPPDMMPTPFVTPPPAAWTPAPVMLPGMGGVGGPGYEPGGPNGMGPGMYGAGGPPPGMYGGGGPGMGMGYGAAHSSHRPPMIPPQDYVPPPQPEPTPVEDQEG